MAETKKIYIHVMECIDGTEIRHEYEDEDTAQQLAENNRNLGWNSWVEVEEREVEPDAPKRKYTLIPSMSLYNNEPSVEFESAYPANSKKWCAEVKEIERRTGRRYGWYRAHRNYASITAISSWRFNWE